MTVPECRFLCRSIPFPEIFLRDFAGREYVNLGDRAARCSSEASHEPLAGTAPLAAGWLLIRSDGAWGSHAVSQVVSAELEQWAAHLSYKIILVRQHASRKFSSGIQYWISRGTDQLLSGQMASLAEIPDVGQAIPAQPMLVICTNGARDQCCALHGLNLRKSLDLELSETERESVWESTHIGGHRFAPTCLYLPGNLVLGRLTVPAAVSLIRHGEITLDNIRGRSHLTQCHQVMERQVAEYWSIVWDEQSATCPETTHTHRGHLNGQPQIFQIEPYSGVQRPESCGGESSIPRSLLLSQLL